MICRLMLILSCLLLALQSINADIKVEGLVHEVINVSFDDASRPLKFTNEFCQPNVPYLTILNDTIKDGTNITYQVQSSLIGIFHIDCQYGDWTERIEVVVGRVKVQENLITNVAMSLGLGFALLIMGMEIELDKVMEVVKKPIGPIVGFCSQFIVMPLLSYGLGYLLLETNYERLGLLLLGCCPGGVGSNFWTAMLDGDINLSITMTFFSSISAFAMTSLWVWLLGSPLVSKDLPIPYSELAIALVSFAVPVLLGMAAKKWKPELSSKIKGKIGRPLWLLCVLGIVIGAIIMNMFFFYLVSWRHLLSGALLGLCGYTIGGGAALLARMERPQIIAVAIETAIQNGGIAVVVLNLTFPSPYSDMALLPILAFFFCSAGPFLFALYLIKNIYTKVKSRVSKDKRGCFQEVRQNVEHKY